MNVHEVHKNTENKTGVSGQRSCKGLEDTQRGRWPRAAEATIQFAAEVVLQSAFRPPKLAENKGRKNNLFKKLNVLIWEKKPTLLWDVLNTH